MVKQRLVILAAVLGLAFAAAACEDAGSSGSGTYYTPSALELQAEAERAAAHETAVAQSTRSAMEAEARATADALANQAQATAQVRDAEATAQAQDIEATRQAWSLQATVEAAAVQATATREAHQATATREALDATATAVQQMATATAQAWAAQVEATRQAARAQAIQATAQAVQRAEERERMTQPLRTFGPWALLSAGVIILGLLVWRFARVAEDRARVIRRQADEGEPLVVISRERMALPLRLFGPYLDATHGEERAPLLAPTVEAQDAATMRQQTANAIQARQAGAIAQAKSKAPRIIAGQAVRGLPAGNATRSRQPVPGLVKVVAVHDLSEATAQGVLPPRLAEVIEGQWEEVKED